MVFNAGIIYAKNMINSGNMQTLSRFLLPGRAAVTQANFPMVPIIHHLANSLRQNKAIIVGLLVYNNQGIVL